ncbi:DUF2905 domain-containing protein [Pollutibacter soli]|uniref:DUF2905 domain-containing protein n=1 Tax=Pollutibacter soli TaxID=3034157 RepID=UPI0030136B4E
MFPVKAKSLIIAGIVLILIGLIWHFFGNKLSWLGRLPGDFRIEKENFSFYFPFTTMILLSIFISLLLFVIKKFL